MRGFSLAATLPFSAPYSDEEAPPGVPRATPRLKRLHKRAATASQGRGLASQQRQERYGEGRLALDHRRLRSNV